MRRIVRLGRPVDHLVLPKVRQPQVFERADRVQPRETGLDDLDDPLPEPTHGHVAAGEDVAENCLRFVRLTATVVGAADEADAHVTRVER